MIISKKRINSIDKYLSVIEGKQNVYVCVLASEDNISRVGINKDVDKNCVVPIPVGPVTRFNLNGKNIIHKEQEKELREIERDYHVVDWHGTDYYGTCIQQRMCYPKEYIMPPLSRIILDNEKLRSDMIPVEAFEVLKHTINMFLELFGYCEVLSNEEQPVDCKTKIEEVPWRILPKGKYPWEKIANSLEEYFENSPKNKEVLRRKHKTLAEYKPDFLAIGENSFSGYVVYGYTSKDIYIFESNQSGNATYVFKGEWERASKLTKFDIITGKLCFKRIIHSKSWEKSVNQLFV